MLHARELPPSGGGPTCFLDMRAAYEMLDAPTRGRPDGLRVVYAHNNEERLPATTRRARAPTHWRGNGCRSPNLVRGRLAMRYVSQGTSPLCSLVEVGIGIGIGPGGEPPRQKKDRYRCRFRSRPRLEDRLGLS